MATNFPGPYELDIPYIVSDVQHRMRISVTTVGNPVIGSPPENVILNTRSGGTVTFIAAANGLWNAVRGRFNTNTTFAGPAILWRYEGNTLQKTFITSVALTNVQGNSSAQNQLAGQTVITLRSGNGS